RRPAHGLGRARAGLRRPRPTRDYRPRTAARAQRRRDLRRPAPDRNGAMTSTQPTLTLPRDVASFLARDHELFIGGRWQPSASGQRFTSTDPATGRTLATLAEGGAADVDDAVA